MDTVFRHWYGVGHQLESKLKRSGYRCWADIVERSNMLPIGDATRAQLVRYAQRSIDDVAAGRIGAFATSFPPQERWQVLRQFIDRASFFDCETTGLHAGAQVTVIAVYHRGSIRCYVRGRDLDQFCDLLPEIDLLVSFSGSHFDIPHVCKLFNIPNVPCPHLDLRWICYYRELVGGLKRIASQLGVPRNGPASNLAGEDAVRLWQAHRNGVEGALELLLEYVQSDVELTRAVAHAVVQEPT